MAQAAKTTIPVVVTSEAPGVTLTLTLSEAETLAKIMTFVGGDPVMSRRKDTDSIHKALRTVGLDGLQLDLGRGEYLSGTLTFKHHSDSF